MNINKKSLSINNKQMAFIDEGNGETLIFIHGNPTSSFLWRNIAPHFIDKYRVIVPDLIGMGDSEKLEGIDNENYNFKGHYRFLSELIKSLNIMTPIHLVIHDWGCALGLKYARHNPLLVKSITFMEGMTIPLSWDQWPEIGTKIFKLFRSEIGEELVLDKNIFVERILFTDPIKPMDDEIKNKYLDPFKDKGEGRRPTLSWPRNIPLDGEPKDVYLEMSQNAEFHKNSQIPKLFINAEPGFLLVGSQRDEVRKWKNLTEVTVKGKHFIQEDSPEEITKNIKTFLNDL